MRWNPERSETGPELWLAGGGSMGELIGSMTWVATALGAIEKWPQSLRTALGICLAFPGPCCLAWGTGRMQLYNEAYSRLCGGRHPGAMGEDFADSWPEAWPTLRASFDRALAGQASQVENQRVLREREEGLLSFAFIPVRDEFGSVRGVLISIIDPTPKTQRLALQQAHDDLDAYNYTISHDFRAPLRTMTEMTRIVVADYAPQLPADALRLMKHVIQGAAKLADRADALLHVARLSRKSVCRHRVDVSALVDAVIAELHSASSDRRVDVVVGDLPDAHGDAELVRLVFTNILSNAFKFTRNAGPARIDVGSQPQERHNVYYVRDNGAGFDMKYAGKLYGFFQRLHSEPMFDGIGMGLALARRLIERHGGTIWAEAEKGQGATFYFTLPAYRACGGA